MNIMVLSDLHLSRKPWQVRKALQRGNGSDLVLLTGDLTNDGISSQFDLIFRCISDILPEIPVLAVTGNHDYPITPFPDVKYGICDYMTLQEWLLRRQSYPYYLDKSGAYVVLIRNIEIIGLNCVNHWRNFQFGEQLEWLEKHLSDNRVGWHVVMCHAPLRLHNPLGNPMPYVNRDKELQAIIDRHKHCLFLSGHTHVSMESSVPCIEYDEDNQNLYINSGSIRPTVILDHKRKSDGTTAQGNVVKIELTDWECKVSVIGMTNGEILQTYQVIQNERLEDSRYDTRFF